MKNCKCCQNASFDDGYIIEKKDIRQSAQIGARTANARSVWICSKCGKAIRSGQLLTDYKGVPYKPDERPNMVKRRKDI